MYSLGKSERIHLKKHIDELFTHGKGFVAYPLRVVSLCAEETAWVEQARGAMMVSVGKRYFKRANKRNRVKRLVREAYRLNKHPWLAHLEQQGLRGRIAFMFVGKELPKYHDIERAMLKALSKVVERHQAAHKTQVHRT